MHLPSFLQSDQSFLPLNLGGNPFGWTSSPADSFAVLDRFREGGGSFVDTADAYSCWADGHSGGESEQVIGDWMTDRGARSQMQIATKVAKKPDRMGLAHDNVVAALDESLDRLQTNYVDLYYAHADDESVPVADQVATFHSLVKSGKVRAIGLSNYSAERLQAWVESAREQRMTLPAAIQPRYTMVSRSDYETQLVPVVQEFGLAVFSYPALASGFLTGKYRTEADFASNPRGGAARRYAEAGGLRVVDALVRVAERHEVTPTSVAIAWLLGRGITAPIASASVPEQLEPLLVGARLGLSEQDVSELDEASAGF